MFNAKADLSKLKQDEGKNDACLGMNGEMENSWYKIRRNIKSKAFKKSAINNAKNVTEDDIFFDYNIGFNKETSGSFPRDREYYENVTHFDHIIGSNDEVAGSFPSDSETYKYDIPFDHNIVLHDEMSDSFPNIVDVLRTFLGFEPN